MSKLRVDKIAAPIVQDEFTGSVYFNGDGDYLRVNGGTTESVTTDDFTIEGWIYKDNKGANAYFFDCRPSPAVTTGNPLIYITGSTLVFYRTAIHIQTTIELDKWIHIALTRQNCVYKLWMDGVLQGTYSDTTSVDLITSSSPVLGTRSSLDNTYSLRGYISNFRICKGHAVYTSNFTPPTRELKVHTKPPKGVILPEADNITVLLACQDANNPLTEATGRHTITGARNLGGVPGQELVTNGNFASNSDWADYQSPTTSELSTEKSYDETNNWKIVADAAIDGITQTFSTSSVTKVKYLLTGYFYSTTGEARIRWRNGADSAWLWDQNVGDGRANVWQRFEVTVEESNGGSSMGLRLTANAAGTFYFDNISVTSIAPTNEANPGLLRRTNVTSTISETTGSVFFDGSVDYLDVEENGNDFDFPEDFTIETWINFDTVNSNNWHDFLGSGNNSAYLGSSKSGWIASYYTLNVTGLQFRLSYQNNSAWEFELGWNFTATAGRWYHLVYTRHNGLIKCYVNGIALARSTTSGTVGEGTPIVTSEGFLRIGGGYGTTQRRLHGYLSNLRICKGHAVYKSDFIPPGRELEVHGGPDNDRTVLLACYDAENIFADKTERHGIAAYGDRKSSVSPAAGDSPTGSVVSPGLIRQVDPNAGPTFQGGAGFVSQNWLTLPKGTTVDRDRAGGRGLFSGGYVPGNFLNTIEYIQISTRGNSKYFGDLISAVQIGEGGKASNHIKGLTGGGNGSPGLNKIEYVFISSTGNGVDFGLLTQNRRSLGGAGSNTRAVFVGGTTGSMTNRIDYVTIATLGNAEQFGDLTVARRNVASNASPTRGVFAGGNPGPDPYVDDTMDFITMASLGDAKDFGNLSVAQREQASAGNSTRGLIGGAYAVPGGPVLNTIQYISLASLGDAKDFGDMTVGGSGRAAVSNGVSCVFGGGSTPAYTNTMDYVTIASTGNAMDFGDLNYKPFLYSGQQISDSHGGIA